MSKIIIFAQFLFILATCPFVAMAVDIIEISAGSQDSASQDFAMRLSQLWGQKYPEEKSKFEPKYVENVNQRFEELRKKGSAFVIAPLKSIGPRQMKKMKIKVALVLWKTFLAAFSLKEQEQQKTLAERGEWFVMKNSVIIPTVFGASPGLYNKPKITEVDSDGLEDIYGQEGALFFEVAGSINDLYKALGKRLSVLEMDSRLIKLLLRKHSWLEAFELSEPDISSVSLTMALFVHKDQDPELVKKVIKTLMNPPRSIFPRPHIIKNLCLSETSQISYSLLHSESLKYFKRALR